VPRGTTRHYIRVVGHLELQPGSEFAEEQMRMLGHIVPAVVSAVAHTRLAKHRAVAAEEPTVAAEPPGLIAAKCRTVQR